MAMIVRQGDVSAFDFDGLEIRDYTATLDLSSSFAAITVPPGGTHRVSWSQRSDKYYYVLYGRVEFTDGDRTLVLTEGDFCVVRRGDRFSYRNVSTEPARLCLFHTPSFDAGSEEFE
jgi:mannose-6-phosphate isomerase-like protein (cupin superfamily)